MHRNILRRAGESETRQVEICIAFRVEGRGQGRGGGEEVIRGARRQTDLLHWSLFQLMSQWNGRTQQVSLKPQSAAQSTGWWISGKR